MKLRQIRLSLLLLASMLSPQLIAQQQDDAGALSPEKAEELNSLLDAVEQQRSEAARIEARLAAPEGVAEEILQRRLEAEQFHVIEAAIAYARAVARAAAAGQPVDDYIALAVTELAAEIGIANTTWANLAARTEFPDTGLDAADQAARNWSFINAQRTINRLTRLLGDSFELLEEFGTALPAEQATFAERLRERGLNGSVYLQMAQDAALSARASATAVPGDSELSARVAVATNLVSEVAGIFNGIATELERLGDETAVFRQQIITTTGEITPEAFNVSVIRGLLSDWGAASVEAVRMHGPTIVFRVFVFLLILFVFVRLSRITDVLVGRALNRPESLMSELLKRMTISLASKLVLATGLLIALAQFGISLGPLLAGLGIAGFIIGFALQDSLANFASGIMILFYRPYDVGDIIETGGVLGKVDQMSLVNTTINTFDNQRIVMPNSMIWGNTITNVTAEKIRRVDMKFGISYSDDIPATEKILMDIVTSHELVLKEPEPIVKVHELGDSSVNFVVRPWTETAHYWDVYWDITRAVKIRFDESGISIPFPQRDVHLFTETEGRDGVVPGEAQSQLSPHRQSTRRSPAAGPEPVAQRPDSLVCPQQIPEAT